MKTLCSFLGLSVLVLAACNSEISPLSRQAILDNGGAAGDGRMKVRAMAGFSSAAAVVSSGRIELSADDALFKKVDAATLASAVIRIREIQVRDINGTYFKFQVDPFDLDLLQLQSQFAAVLGRASLPEGSYDGIRLITEDLGEVVFTDGRHEALSVPSGTQTGIKIFPDALIQIQSNLLTVVTAQFDVDNSFVENANGIFFKPVLHVAVAQVEVPPPVEPSPDPTPTPSPTPSPTPDPTPAPDPTPTPDPIPLDPGTVPDDGSGSSTVIDPPVDGGGDDFFPPVLGV